ncbi:MAG: hypothetical protein Q7T05_03295 [Dehalococcoidia bacterium]|nr:hypothetical protein [Dehalococcoidia bacterium]
MMLMENLRICEGIKPATAAGAKSGDWVSLKGFERLLILVHIAQGNAATTAITVDKATLVDGTGNSDGITMNNWWKLVDTPQTADTWVKGTAAASITSSATGTGSSLYAIEIAASELGAYDCVQVELGASNAANVVSAAYLLSNARFAEKAANWLSAMVD